jgi:hypothetical protein
VFKLEKRPNRKREQSNDRNCCNIAIALIDASLSISARLLTPGMEMFSTSGDRNVYHCGGTMLACRATSCQLSPCFIHIPVKRRCAVLPAFGIFPPHTTVSLPATIAVSP